MVTLNMETVEVAFVKSSGRYAPSRHRYSTRLVKFRVDLFRGCFIRPNGKGHIHLDRHSRTRPISSLTAEQRYLAMAAKASPPYRPASAYDGKRPTW